MSCSEIGARQPTVLPPLATARPPIGSTAAVGGTDSLDPSMPPRVVQSTVPRFPPIPVRPGMGDTSGFYGRVRPPPRLDFPASEMNELERLRLELLRGQCAVRAKSPNGRGESLGHGSFGDCFVHKSSDGSEWAVKQISLSESLRQRGGVSKAASRLRQEIACMKRLRGAAGVVQLKRAAVSHNHLFLCMDRVTGHSPVRLGAVAARDCLMQLTAIVRECHSRGVSHGDIKPKNLKVAADRTLVLLDFGEAECLDKVSELMCGTVEYQPPPLFREFGADSLPQVRMALDIWTAGATIVRLLSGESPSHNPELRQAQLEALAIDDAFRGDLALMLQHDPLERRLPEYRSEAAAPCPAAVHPSESASAL